MSLDTVNNLNNQIIAGSGIPIKTPVLTVKKADDNKGLSTAAKYMIGATALAGTIAAGIIGHKNNWWRNVEKSVQSHGGNNLPPPPDNKPNPPEFYKYVRTELENGYELFCEGTSKRFRKIKDELGNAYRYENKLENGNTIHIEKHNVAYSTGNIAPNTNTYIFNRKGEQIYQSTYDQFAEVRSEIFYDFDTMTAYECVARKGKKECYRKIPFVIKGGGQEFETPKAEIITPEDMARVRKNMLDNNLPPRYSRIKAKFMNLFEHSVSNSNSSIHYTDAGERIFKKKFANGSNITYYTYPNDTKSFTLYNQNGLNVYEYRKTRLNKNLVESENFVLPDGVKYSKKYNSSTNEHEYICNNKIISEEEFIKNKNYILAFTLPENTTAKFSRQLHVPRNSSGEYIINVSSAYGPKEIQVKYPDSLRNKYEIKYFENSDKIKEYIKYDSDGSIIEKAMQDFDDDNLIMIIPFENGKAEADKIVRKSYENCDFSNILAELKDVNGII